MQLIESRTDTSEFERKSFCCVCGADLGYSRGNARYCAEHKPLIALRKGRRRLGSSWRPFKPRILERDGHTCIYCKKPTNDTGHVLAFSMGGATATNNGVACCPECNRAAGYRLDIRGLEYLMYIGEDMEWTNKIEWGAWYDAFSFYAWIPKGEERRIT